MQVKEPSFVMVDGRKLAYDEVCPANPKGTVLLLTGLAAKRLGWYHQMEEFGRYYRTIAIDHRDVGDSDLVTTPYTVRDQAEDAAQVLKALGIQKAYVVGISMGGFIAQELALQHPEMVEKLVLTSTSSGGATHVQPSPQIQAMLVERGGSADPATRARYSYSLISAPGFSESHPADMDMIAEIATYRPQPAEAYFRQLQACLGHETATRLSQIKVPTLVIHGDVDPLVPVENGKFLAEHIPGAKLVLYSNTGHIPHIERPAEYNRDVLAFLAS